MLSSRGAKAVWLRGAGAAMVGMATAAMRVEIEIFILMLLVVWFGLV